MTSTIQLVAEPSPEIQEAIRGPLKRQNDARLGEVGVSEVLALTLMSAESSEIIGGLWGWTSRGWLYVDLLFVPESLRASGIGRSLMQRAEREALGRGCHAAWLSTFSFQAPDFYQKLGYRVFGELPDYPLGHSSIFLTKRLVLEAQ